MLQLTSRVRKAASVVVAPVVRKRSSRGEQEASQRRDQFLNDELVGNDGGMAQDTMDISMNHREKHI